MDHQRASVGIALMEDGRFGVMLIDPEGIMSGPDDGDDHRGYTREELIPLLQGSYGLSAADANACIDAAVTKRKIAEV
jgi:hypothetical protein